MQNKCPSCGFLNRDEALFCRKCGVKLPADSFFADFLGKKNLEGEFAKLRLRAKAAAQIKKRGAVSRLGMDCLVSGNPGCGKSFVTAKIVSLITSEGAVEKAAPVTVDAADWDSWSDNLDANLDSAKYGILVILNAQKLLGEDGSAGGIGDLDKLFSRMADPSVAMPVVIMCGNKGAMETFCETNPAAAALFECRFDVKNLEKEDLAAICEQEMKKDFGVVPTPEASRKILQRFDWLLRNRKAAGGGHVAVTEAQEIGLQAMMRGSTEVVPSDIKGEVFVPRSEEQIRRDFDSLIGLQNVKDEVYRIIDKIKEARDEGREPRIESHYVFTGNPGTGKTTIARNFADMLSAVGALPKGQLVETSGKDLISEFVGGTEKNVQQAVDDAMGGILFIDEAYGLNDGKFGQAAIDKLVPILENKRGDFVCIIAGYSEDMRRFLKANSGLASRFNKTIEFPDYNPAELEAIFRSIVSGKGFRLDSDADAGLHAEMEKMYNRKTSDFGNGRDVRNAVERALERRRERLRGQKASDKVLVYSDIVGPEALQEINLDDVMSELDALVGLEGVKKNIRALAAGIKREKRLCELQGRTPKLTADHYLFLGNPGTGKTTVARLMGKMLCSLGLLQRPDVKEVSRADLCDRYQGGTAQKTREAVRDAMGGILFIDEAYSLYNSQGDSYGKECIDTLVPLLYNERGKFVCICAGYTREMQQFMETNSGLGSRFKNTVIFEDYSASELYDIFLMSCKKEGLTLGEGVPEAVFADFEAMTQNRRYDFGNAREVGTYLSRISLRLSERTASIEEPTLEQLTTLTLEDLI